MPTAPAKIRFIGPIRDLTRDDLAATFAPAFKLSITADKIRDSHHRIARLAAAGLRKFEIVERTGYSYNRVHALLGSPAMIELVAKYRDRVNAAFERQQDSFLELATQNMLKAERLLADRLEAQDDPDAKAIPVRDLVAISRDAADRFGYGKKSQVTNVNADFAEQLAQAIARSGKVIEPTPDQPMRRRA